MSTTVSNSMMARPSRGHRRSLVDISKPEANRVLFREPETTRQKDWWKTLHSDVRIAADEGPQLGLLSLVVRVGSPPSTTDFSVHESLICSRSPFFANAMNGSWAEADSRIVPLPDDAPATFALYRTWLYTGLLTCKTDSSSEEWDLLACAYVLGEKLQDSDFKDAVIDAMIEKLNHYLPILKEKPSPPTKADSRTPPTSSMWAPNSHQATYAHPFNSSNERAMAWLGAPDASGFANAYADAEAKHREEVEYFKRNPAILMYIYENTPPNSPLRRLLVDHYRASAKPDWISEDKRDLLPEDFLYSLSYQFMMVKSNEENGVQNPLWAPYKADNTCAYHEHGDKMCYVRRRRTWTTLNEAPKDDKDRWQSEGWLMSRRLGWKMGVEEPRFRIPE